MTCGGNTSSFGVAIGAAAAAGATIVVVRCRGTRRSK
jgi:hypothetical protein